MKTTIAFLQKIGQMQYIYIYIYIYIYMCVCMCVCVCVCDSMRFLLQSFSISFLVFRGTVFFFFFSLSSPLDYGVRFQYYQVLASFLFSEPSDFFLIWKFSSFCYLFFPLFIMTVTHFSMQNSIPISWQYIHFICIRISNSFSFL